jgi:hypothetical protein
VKLNRFLLIFLFWILSFTTFSQKNEFNDSLKQELKSGTTLAIVSLFPYYVGKQTLDSKSPETYRIFYGSVWIGFGIILDLCSIKHIVSAIKINRKKNKK